MRFDPEAARSISGYWYVASPYSRYQSGMHDAHLHICKVMARLIRGHVPCFSPISHSHWVALYGYLNPTGSNMWFVTHVPLMNAAHGLIVIEMYGWEESVGVQMEIDHFAIEGKPIMYAGSEELACLR